MSVWPRRLWVRLGLAGLVAVAVIVGLEWSLRQRDVEAAQHAESGAVDGAAIEVAATAEAGALPDPGFHAAAVVLTATVGAEPAAQAVWQLLPQGQTVLRVVAPLPTAPDRRTLSVVAVALPEHRLAALDPVQRAGLLDLLSALFADRPVAAERLRLVGVTADAADVAALLRWLR